ncbi:MAG: YfiR family protein [Alphaproteobacteria bacterium]|nr:YfiR family protein [Alphaproteobacteria bacterium]MBV9553474.1 YfiR family protein [Alphaproteobacteria bacterium]
MPAARRGRGTWVLAALWLGLAAAPAPAQDNSLELAVKATYLVRFAAFVEWPQAAFESPTSPLNLCIAGGALGPVVEQAASGQAVGQHPIAVRLIAAAAHGAGCHILFAGGTSQQSVDTALIAVRREPVLTVTDLPAAAALKGVINFVMQAGHVRFEIDEREAAAGGLRISSQLLALAVNIGAR